ncbi:type I secretion system permease/ATPase [Roseobacter sinensis]|uniref:Type I secretion system permease/ATPase n=1 Tax=Roseobacter sinensis TaxID=2931391 RepID=A0ABT3BK51_9RHOB|nr:type I secretion system permease/ATPase [Roseobacter sp. WL0113]MCV3273949.1 type I secretion system permease/ATPase [Roseobacter sp. WL0113]
MASIENSQVSELAKARNAGTNFIVISFVFSIFVNLLMLTGPLFMLQVYDRVLGSGSEETLVALFVLVGFLYGLMAMLEYARGRIVARFGARFQALLDRRIFGATLELSGKRRPSEITGLRDIEAIQSVFSSPVFLALMDMPWSPFFVAAIFIFHPMLGWLAVAGALVLIVLALVNQIMTHKKVARAQGASNGAQAFADQAQIAHEVVQAQGMRGAVTDRWLMQRNEALREKISSNDWTGSFTAVTKSFRLFLQSAMLAVGAYYVLQGEMTAGAMIAGTILLGRALQPIEQSLGQWPMLQRARLAWHALGDLLSEIPQPGRYVNLPEPEASLSTRNLTLIPPGGQLATLKNVTFQVKPGSAIGLIGKSGSGKSTLARAIMGLWKPAAGEVRLGGVELGHYDPDRLGDYIGYLPQQVSLLPGTIAENIARMAVQPDDARVVEAAKKANAHEMIIQLPDGYNTYVDGNDNILSGGQRQRVALARAVFGSPVLLVLDEPNSALDVEGSNALNEAVRQLKEEGKSVIIMTHRPMAISECDELVVMDKGTIVDAGPRDEILRKQLKNADQIKRVIQPVGAVS